ncbi:hypothetical protein K440DRAFT_274891 [Wilcoxina mikolae CBS 423.85]|nr:hypothetical protein K440DRAFT_274891 [Wilcoxina mikolae CBS 423.85]
MLRQCAGCRSCLLEPYLFFSRFFSQATPLSLSRMNNRHHSPRVTFLALVADCSLRVAVSPGPVRRFPSYAREFTKSCWWVSGCPFLPSDTSFDRRMYLNR